MELRDKKYIKYIRYVFTIFFIIGAYFETGVFTSLSLFFIFVALEILKRIIIISIQSQLDIITLILEDINHKIISIQDE